MNKQDEIQLVRLVLTHPAGFNLDLFGGMLNIRTTDQNTIEVEWEELNGKKYKSFSLTELDQACEYFVEKRYDMELGIDFEAELI